MDERIAEPLMAMLEAAERRTGAVHLPSGYRTQEKQQSLYDEKIQEYHRAQGIRRKRPCGRRKDGWPCPARAEHQLGIAVDINGAVEVYPCCKRTATNMVLFSAIPGRRRLDRHSGRSVALPLCGRGGPAQIYERGLCLEEYLETLVTRPPRFA